MIISFILVQFYLISDSNSRSDWIVKKYDIESNENSNWGQQIGDTSNDNAYDIAFDSSNNVIISGSDSANWTVKKYDNNFNLLKFFYDSDLYVHQFAY